MSLQDEIIAIAKKHDVDLVGIARVEEIELAYPPRPAEDLLHGAKTAVVFGCAILWGGLNCPRGTKGAIKDSQVAYDRAQEAGAAIGRYLESRGYASYMPPASMPTDAHRHNGATYYAAEWSHRQAAIAAKMGVRGMNNLLITPEYGPYLRLGSMLTTAEIEPTDRELPEGLCNHCMKCVAACPVGALTRNPDKVPRLTQPLCKNHYARPYLDHTVWQTVKNIFTVEGWGSTGIQAVLEGYHFSCAECQRVCPRGDLSARSEKISEPHKSKSGRKPAK